MSEKTREWLRAAADRLAVAAGLMKAHRAVLLPDDTVADVGHVTGPRGCLSTVLIDGRLGPRLWQDGRYSEIEWGFEIIVPIGRRWRATRARWERVSESWAERGVGA